MAEWSRDELQDPRPGRGELLGRRPAIGGAADRAGLHLLAQPGDADLEELIEVAREDGQELGPLQQRVALVAGLVEDAGVELEPGQLTVQVRQVRAVLGRSSRAGRDHGSRGCSGFDGGHLDERLLGSVAGGSRPVTAVARLAAEDSTARSTARCADAPVSPVGRARGTARTPRTGSDGGAGVNV